MVRQWKFDLIRAATLARADGALAPQLDLGLQLGLRPIAGKRSCGEAGTVTETAQTRVTGQVKWFNNTKGYGFVVCEDRPDLGDLFAHFSSIDMEGYKTLKAGQIVTFEVADGPKGLHAAHIQSDDEQTAHAADAVDQESATVADDSVVEEARADHDGIDVQLPTTDEGTDEISEDAASGGSLRQSR